MADENQVVRLKLGVDLWNAWRDANRHVGIEPDLRAADLRAADLARACLNRADLAEADLARANLTGADLRAANLPGAQLRRAHLGGADLTRANLSDADLRGAYLPDADLSRANLAQADLRGADLRGANLSHARLKDAKLSGADLSETRLLRTDLAHADLSECRIHGVSVWGVKLDEARQSNLVITRRDEPTVTVDSVEVAQFVYLLLYNAKIRDVINTVGKKGVLILGRFAERKHVVEALREALRERDYVPIVFDFERPTDKDFTETVMTLAGMCLFIIADITRPQSVPLELQATVPNYMIPFVPIIGEREKPFSMFADLWTKYRDWVLEPLRYDSVSQLVGVLDRAVIEPAKQRRELLEAKKAEALITRHAKDYE